MARALRFQANLPLSFCRECVITVAYIINLLPTPVLNGQTPYEILLNKKPSYDHWRVFDCLCFAYNHSPSRKKFDVRAMKCIFVGYPHGLKGYCIYDLRSKHIFTSRDVIFYEHIFPYSTMSSNLSSSIVVPLPLLDDYDSSTLWVRLVGGYIS